MFDPNIIPANLNITGYRKLKAAVSAGTVTPEAALAACEAIAKARNGNVTGRLAIVLDELRAGKWQKAEAKAEAKPAATAKAAAPTPEPAPETETDDLVGMEWDDLRALGRTLGVKARRRADLTERIRAARLAKAKVQAKTEPAAPAPAQGLDAATIAKLATEAAIAAVNAYMAANR